MTDTFERPSFAQHALARTYYETHGYVVFSRLIPDARIDAVSERFTCDIKASRKKYFRQNTSRYEPNTYSEQGYVLQSFLDIHAYESQRAFQHAALELYFSEEMKLALSAITGEATHHLMQSMLFDMNTATSPHQDYWYLDSVPSGALLAAWIAMEDIDERAGRFFVLPDSWQTTLHEEGLSHTRWLDRMRVHVQQNSELLRAPALRKGDVLFWNSRTIHGAYPTLDPRFSRKSLTAHYLPASHQFGNLFKAKPWIQYTDWRGNKYFANQPEYSLSSDLVSRAKRVFYDHPRLMKLARRFQSKALSDL